MDKIRICLVGAGRAGEVHGDVYKKCIPESEIVAIVDENCNKAKSLAKKYKISEKSTFSNLKEAMSNLKFEAVVITTPTFTHAGYAIEAAKNKVHVFCEKPMCITIDECNQMIKSCKENKVILQVGFMRRFDPGFSYAKNSISNGAIGKPIIIKSLTRGPGLPGKWSYDIKNSNGMLAEVNSHDFDTIRWLAESEYESIFAIADNFKCSEIGKKYKKFYDSAVVNIRLKNGTMGLIDGVCPCHYGYDARTEVVGTKGVMFIGSLKGSSVISCTRESGITTPQVLSWKKRFHEAYIAEDRHFIDCIFENNEPLVTGKDGKKVVEAVISANKSIFKKIPVYI
ncbi:MAG: Gfo/Idh/MocA family oxidoreductase [Actinobacteria bacterium]|nr:Gfo/Idh/MocA family oxidoreductase [Actinomycetota bacterium]